jgi:hypothetical protein
MLFNFYQRNSEAMSETKHTPGPWRMWSDTEENEVYGRVIGIQIHAGPNTSIGSIHGLRSADGDVRDQAFANANLIAAAPELLDVLENLVALTEIRPKLHEYKAALDEARAVIAKAKGETINTDVK